MKRKKPPPIKKEVPRRFRPGDGFWEPVYFLSPGTKVHIFSESCKFLRVFFAF